MIDVRGQDYVRGIKSLFQQVTTLGGHFWIWHTINSGLDLLSRLRIQDVVSIDGRKCDGIDRGMYIQTSQ